MKRRRKPIRLSADIGGTFTDLVLDTGGERRMLKVLTTPRAPEEAVLEGAAKLLAHASLTFGDLDFIVHGTTLATNAIIERKGARVGLLATQGFRDVIEIADEGRYDQYDLFLEKPKHLVPRPWRFPIPERMDVHGNVLLPLDEKAVAKTADACRRAGIDAVAIAFLHSYQNPAHERRAAQILAQHVPGLSITLSSEVCPEAREYERTSTAICNAYVQPLIAGYLERLQQAFRMRGATAPIRLMSSGGSLVALETAARFPIRLVESGPAGGALLAARLAEERGERRVLSFDMGGTTAKICMVSDGKPLTARSFEIDRAHRFRKGSGLPVRIPVIEMVEIGAGGGSLARVDSLKRIEVGPQSAGSEPGPACYGRGGRLPTVTDADLVIGKIDPARFADGSIILFPEAAEAALIEGIGKPLNIAAVPAALGIAAIVDENMANAARVHAVERGMDVAAHTMIAFGGAAPLHACAIAAKLGISRIIVPDGAGVGSAIGFLAAPPAYEVIRSRYMRLDHFDPIAAERVLAELGCDAQSLASAAAPKRTKFALRRFAYMRYAGQGHEIAIRLPDRRLRATDPARLRAAFEVEYARLFARYIPGAIIEIMSWQVIVAAPEKKARRLPSAPRKAAPNARGRVMVHSFAGRVSHAVYDRADFLPGARVEGPAIILEAGTSTLVAAGFTAAMDSGRALVLSRKENRR